MESCKDHVEEMTELGAKAITGDSETQTGEVPIWEVTLKARCQTNDKCWHSSIIDDVSGKKTQHTLVISQPLQFIVILAQHSEGRKDNSVESTSQKEKTTPILCFTVLERLRSQ